MQLTHRSSGDTMARPGWRSRVLAWRWALTPTAAFAISRLAVFLVAYLGAHLVPDNTAPPVYHLRPPENTLLDVFGSRWDTGFYVSIAEEGYVLEGVPLPSVPFFPLLPLLMRGVGWLTGADVVLAGVVIANLALLLAAVAFYRLVADRWDDDVAGRAVWYLMIFPTALYGSAIYSESLFLLATIGALLMARRRRWIVAGLLAIAATLTRFVGLIVIPLLLFEWWRQCRQDGAWRWSGLVAAGMAPLGTLGYMAYLGRAFGDPLAFLSASAAWDRVARSPWAMLAELFERPAAGWLPAVLAGQIHIDNWLDFGFVAAFLLFAGILLYEQEWGDGLFVMLGVLIPLSSGLLMSQRRYMWVLFPAYVLLARAGRHRWVDRALTALFLAGLALFTILYAGGYWVA